jgi:hypothetical protein
MTNEDHLYKKGVKQYIIGTMFAKLIKKQEKKSVGESLKI